MRLIKSVLVILLISISCKCFAENKMIYSFNNNSQQQQFDTLTYELRCLVCQNQNLAESNATLAADLRTQIAEMIVKGFNNQEIVNYLVNRYGDYILYEPPVMKKTWLLWFGPFILLAVGLSVLYIAVYIIRRRENKLSEISTIEKQKIKRILSAMEE